MTKSEREIERTYYLGQSVGLDEAANLLLNKASQAFKDGRDQEASMLRELSKEIQKRGDDRYIHPDPFKGIAGGPGK